ncbi:cellulose biosynthesis protein CelD [Streptomyces amritsarensis]|uniref:Cellulose biosynthesis protein CelD n=1 Tax=Streptomyces amritsarensis TaxID=681158 RepID=A0ABX3FZW8_9ACTN|nr:GNAT family N-acetyltransferase [Streptomyces amritsarensis]OLZ63857.1 cellulose biosynthesis protein CelD [Streptomyces amritsarensis]
MTVRRIDVIRPAELTPDDLELWGELRASTAPEANPFMSPEFCRAVGRVRPGARVAVVRQDGEPAGFFPFERGRWGRGRAIGLGVSDCQGAVLRPGAVVDPHELLRASSLSVWEFNHLESGQDLFLPFATGRFASPVIDLTGGYAGYEIRLRAGSRTFLKTTRAQERRLARQAGPLRFVFDERSPAVLRTLMAWKSAQYRRTGRRDRFAQSWINNLVTMLAATRAPSCSGLLSVLYAGGRPVAAHFGLRSRSVLSCWFPAYDRDFATFSPGRVLYLRMIEAAAAAGIDMLDLGRGDAAYKDSLKTRELIVHEGAVLRAGTGAALHWLSHEPPRAVRGFVRERPQLKAAALRTLATVGRMRDRTSGP